MKVWLDDVRPPPDDTWTVAKTAKECIRLLDTNSGAVELCSLDHDLGSEKPGEDGYEVLRWIERNCSKDPEYLPPRSILVHTSNPVARERMYQALRSIIRIVEAR